MNDLSDSDLKKRNVVPFPDATVFAHLKACQKITAEHAQDLFDSFHSDLDEKLLEFMDKAKSNQEANDLQETLRNLRRNGSQIRQRFSNCVSDGFVKFKEKTLNTRTGEEKYRSDVLSLVDNEDLEETIALSSIAQHAEEQFGETLWFLNQRFTVLNDGQKVHSHNNPVSPIQFCEALRKALALTPLDTKSKIIAYKVFDSELTDRLSTIIGDVNKYLARQEILPDLQYMAVKNGSPPAASPSVEESPPDYEEGPVAPQSGNPEMAGSQAYAAAPAPGPATGSPGRPATAAMANSDNLVQAIRTLQYHLAGTGGAVASGASPWAGAAPVQTGAAPVPGGAAPTQGGMPGAAGPTQGGAAAPSSSVSDMAVYSNQQLVSALQTLQSQALAMTTAAGDAGAEAMPPQNIAAVGQQLAEELRAQSPDGQVDPEDMHTIDLVGMLFEYMLSDEQLPDSVKTLLSYLHTPFLKVAFLDSSFFEKDEHPARLLLNNLAEAGTRWVGNDGSSHYDVFTKIKEVVFRVLDEFENDVRLFAELLLEFSSFVKKIARRQDLLEKRALEKVQGEEKLREVKVRVNREVSDRIEGKELPSAVLLLLLQPWSDYLAFVLLRYGEQSESWERGVGAVDELLWSIEARDAGDQNRDREKLDDLLDIIESGFETIGYDQSKSNKLISALVSLQKMAMQSRKPEPAPPPMRDKLETEAAERAGANEERNEHATPEEKKMVENLKMIEFGTWFEFEGGKRLKVAWYNSKTMHYMLVDQTGKKVAMKSGLELARGMLSGKARVIAGSTKPFFERALENILHNLSAQVEEMEPEKGDV